MDILPKGCETYMKRVTWVKKAPEPLGPSLEKAVVEYKGFRPGLILPHGNTMKHSIPYTRTPAKTMEQIQTNMETMKPQHIYMKMLEETEIDKGPRDLNQIYNMKRYHNNKNAENSVKNFADQVQKVATMSITEPMIKTVNICQNNVTIIIYNDDQIKDIARFCAKVWDV